MIKSYRRKFILSNMILSGIVLLVVFIVLGVVNYRQEYNNLESVMGIVLKPWNSHESSSVSDVSKAPKDKPQEKSHKETGGEPDRKKPSETHSDDDRHMYSSVISHDEYELFTTLIYHTKSNEISYLSGVDSIDTDNISTIVEQIVEERSQFGKLNDYKMIYYKETTPEETKIALIDSSYLTFKIVGRILLLSFVFLMSLGAIFVVSIRLARIACEPLEKAIEMERNFVADISHDLKTPITIVLTNNGILKSNKDDTISEQMQWIESTEAAAKNMMTLVNEMLTLSEIESIGRKVEKYAVSLSSSCEKCILQLESLAYEHNIEIRSNIAEDVDVLSTTDYTERICSGLIENALKYEPAGGCIEVDVFKDKKNAVIKVRNFGSVINEEDIPHIFERFYRADKTRGKTKGHGLGLPIIRQMTELIGGSIGVQSSREEGTVFTVTFEIPI